jgi:CheY-like chemotaxis protein
VRAHTPAPQICHELRNPLHCALMTADLLREDVLPRCGVDFSGDLTMLDEQLGAMTSVLNDVLDSQRMLDGHIFVSEFAPVDVTGMLRDVCQHHRALVRGGVNLRVAVAPDMDSVLVFSDSVRLEQVIGCAVHNACKFAVAGTILVRAAPLTVGGGGGGGEGGDASNYVLFEVINETPPGVREVREEDLFASSSSGSPTSREASSEKSPPGGRGGSGSGGDPGAIRRPSFMSASASDEAAAARPRAIGASHLPRAEQAALAAAFALSPSGLMGPASPAPGSPVFELHGLSGGGAGAAAAVLFSSAMRLPMAATVASALGANIGLSRDARGFTRFWLLHPGARGAAAAAILQASPSPVRRRVRRIPRSLGAAAAAGADGLNLDDVQSPRRPVRRLVLVDDEATLRRLGQRMVQHLGVECDVLEDGCELGPFLTPAHELILLDIVMKRSDGVAVCAALRAAGVRVPIYAMTGNVDPSSVAVFRRTGFNGLLAKPFSQARA